MSRSLHTQKREARKAMPEWQRVIVRRDERRAARRIAARNHKARGFVLVGMLQSIAAAALSLSVWF